MALEVAFSAAALAPGQLRSKLGYQALHSARALPRNSASAGLIVRVQEIHNVIRRL